MESIKSYLTKEGWKRDWEKTKSHVQAFGRMLYDSFVVDDLYAKQRQHLLDLLDNIEERSTAWQNQLAREGKAFTAEGEVVVVRPDLAFPEIYATSPAQPLEARISNIDGLY